MTSPSIVNGSDSTVDRALAVCAHPLDGDCIVPTTACIAGLVPAALITLCGAAPQAITPAATEQCRQSAAVNAELEEQLPPNRRLDVILRAARASAPASIGGLVAVSNGCLHPCDTVRACQFSPRLRLRSTGARSVIGDLSVRLD